MAKIIILISILCLIGYSRAQNNEEAIEELMKLLTETKEELQYQINMASTTQSNLESRIDSLNNKVTDIASKIDKISTGDNLPKAKKQTAPPPDDNESVCGNWQSFKDEKCFKIYNKYETKSFENASKICSELESGSTLVSISSAEEFDFISKSLFGKSRIVDSIWLGAKRLNSTTFKWNDGSYFTIPDEKLEQDSEENEMSEEAENNEENEKNEENKVNEENNEPKQDINNCLEMKRLYSGLVMGQYSIVPCMKKNLVLCQKAPKWSLSHLQKSMVSMKKQLESLTTRFTESISENKFDSSIEELKNSLIPVGFIYVQLPYEKSPQELWPSFEWDDVSANYSNVFFRVIGDETKSFGKIQRESFPRISEVSSSYHQHIKDKPEPTWDIECPTEGWSNWFITARGVYQYYTNFDVYTRFYYSGGEVRPRNMAIKIWARS